jgi:hypothetical protein
MPANTPGYWSDAEVAEILAYMLAASGMPAGANPLPADRTALAAILIVQQAE